MAFGFIFCCAKGKENGENKTSCQVFSLKELLVATNNFNYDNQLGEGAFGSVYWGQLWDGSQIAVKRLKVWSEKAKLEFSFEIEILAKVRHKNLLSLRGYCVEGQELAIVYDFIPNLSLHYHLRVQQSAECVLDWNRRMNIAIGSAEGIAYLHHCAKPHIIHGDIKPSNVLLDSDFQPKVADFGLTKFIPDGTTHETTKAEESSDVYSFGILLLELVSGKRAIQKLNPEVNWSIFDWAFPLAHEENFREIADPKLSGKFEEKELRRVVLVALISAQKQAEKRPTMLEVVELFKGGGEDKLAEFENELFRNLQCGDDKHENFEGCGDSIMERRDLNPE